MKLYSNFLFIIVVISFLSCNSTEIDKENLENYISEEYNSSVFQLAQNGKPVPILCHSSDFEGIQIIKNVFADDLERILGSVPEIFTDSLPKTDRVIIIGTLGQNEWIDALAEQKKIETSIIEGKWEASLIQTVKNPFEGIKEALVIAGSDKRGTIYGMFDVSEKMGVSPWYWWADVPVKQKTNIYVKPGIYTQGEPAIKYRGIFINDEAPALSGWVYEKYGEFNSEFYYQVFELILRLKGNYLWPAMWGKAFNFSDTLNPVLADKLGIVMGTSHHEPMMRAQEEWKLFGKGSWNYNTNQEVLDSFWKEGIKNMRAHESIVTIGMRGDGDEPMSKESNIALLEKIVSNQRSIIEEITGNPAWEQPQIWALYKEVQEYYDKGMRVPDDVTLLLCDDNWGNVRKLPSDEELKHPGGYGMYYHFDYVGGPRNYKWLNTILIPRIWEQMQLTYSYGVDEIWIVNVGDIKPMELPISFFLDYAWNPNEITLENLSSYTKQWSEQQFGDNYAEDIASLLDQYTRFNARRKPEMLNEKTYSLSYNNEFETIVKDYNQLATKAIEINDLLEDKYHDSFYQLVLFPILACSNLNELYYTAALNKQYAKQHRNSTNKLAKKAIELFEKDSLLSFAYNNVLADGKWNHFMDQTHIGYTYWQQPDFNTMPSVNYYNPKQNAKMGVSLMGRSDFWPQSSGKARLPEVSPNTTGVFYFEIFNQGVESFNCSIKSEDPYVLISETDLIITSQKRIEVTIDWEKCPIGHTFSTITIESNNNELIEIETPIFKPEKTIREAVVLTNGALEIEAENYTNKYETETITWGVIPNFGKTLSGVKTFPSNHKSIELSDSGPFLEYSFFSYDTGWVDLHFLFSPTLDYLNKGGLTFAVGFNNNKPQLTNMHTESISNNWENWVGNNIIETRIEQHIDEPGLQKIKLYIIDPGVVLQRILVNAGGLKYSYLGSVNIFDKPQQ